MSESPIIVLGMHRSYTSLLASWLHRNGVVMYEPEQSPQLHAEDLEVVQLHEALLQSQGMNALNARKPFIDMKGHFHDTAKRIVNRKKEQFSYWGWKDPRGCVLYDFLWMDLIPDARVLMIYRDPAEVVESLFWRKVHTRRYYRFVPDHLYYWYFGTHRVQFDLPHLICWNYFNHCLLHLTQKLNPNAFLVINGDELVPQEQRLRDIMLQQWNVSLGHHSFDEMLLPTSVTHSPRLLNIDADVLDESEKILNKLHALRSF